MRARGVGTRDLPVVNKMLKDYGFELQSDKLELLMVAEDEVSGDIIAVSALVMFLEATFMTDKSKPLKQRLEALDLCVKAGERTVKNLGFTSYHAFATNKPIETIMKKRYGYVDAVGVNLIKWVD